MDTTMMGVVAGVSLDIGVELRLRVPDPGFRRAPFHVHLPRRSLYLMTGLSRWHLQHGIPTLMGDRVSLTFRTVDPGCARSLAHWKRSWDELDTEERKNAHLPILKPDGTLTSTQTMTK